MVSAADKVGNTNIITIAWAGTICSNPPMVSISVRPERHSYKMIEETGEFVINLTTKELAYATDYCGVKSGRDVDKFKEMNLTPQKTDIIDSVLIKESPLSIECKVTQIIPLGSHDMFIAEVVNVLADEKYMDKESDAFLLGEAKLVAYNHGNYYKLGEKIGKFGWSVQKKK